MPWAEIGASLLGGFLGDDAASDAAAGQAAATREATQLQREIWQKNLQLNQPAVDAGNLARTELLRRLGLGGTPGGKTTQSRNAIREALLPKYTTTSGGGPMYGENDNYETGVGWANGIHIPIGWGGQTQTIDEAGLNAAIEAELAKGGGVDSTAGDYGSLLKEFTGADLQNEPGYQFGLSEGQKSLDRKAAAGGGYFSGAALKAAQRFGQDYAGTKFNEAFNRDTANKTNIYNRLQGVTGGGQTAANQAQSANSMYANNVGGLTTANANAQGAAGISSAAGWNDAISGALGGYQAYNAQNALQKLLQRPDYSLSNRDYAGGWYYDK